MICLRCKRRSVCFLPCGLLSKEKGTPNFKYTVELWEEGRITFTSEFDNYDRGLRGALRLAYRGENGWQIKLKFGKATLRCFFKVGPGIITEWNDYQCRMDWRGS